MLINVYKVYTGPLSVQAQYSRLCPISSSFRYNGSLVTWTVVCLTADKFKPLIRSKSIPIPVFSRILSARTTHRKHSLAQTTQKTRVTCQTASWFVRYQHWEWRERHRKHSPMEYCCICSNKYLVNYARESHVGLHVNCSLFSSDFSQNLYVSTNFIRTPQKEILWKYRIYSYSGVLLCVRDG
jgi:hypothetical protein